METEALVETLKIKREQDYIRQVNEVNKDTKVAEEHHRMAEGIADNTEVDEFPWSSRFKVSKNRLFEKIGS